MKALCCAALAAAFAILPAHAQQTMNNAAVLKLQGAGLGDDVIVSTISNSPGKYSVSTDDLIALKKAGISDKVIGAMIQKNSGVTPAPSAGAAASTAGVPPGVNEAGVYYLDTSGTYQEIIPEIVNYKTGGVLKGLATGGIVKGDLNGNINGKTSKLPLHSPVTMIIYTLEGQSPNEYQLLHMHQNSNNREFRSKTGGVIHASTGANRDSIEFVATKLAPRVYQLVLPPDEHKGEYGILPPGSANSQANAASAGKIFAFTLIE